MAGATRGLLLVGCGKMGGALLSGWLAGAAAPRPIHVVEPVAAGAAPFRGRPEVFPHSTLDTVPSDFAPAVVVFATKPQGMEAIVPAYRRFAGGDTVFLSIAAGRTIGFFAANLGGEAAIVRAMPNTPAAIGRGISVAAPNARVTEAQRNLCDALLAAAGEVGWVDDERLIDPVTAVSGSGPAYVFLLVECLAEAGVAAGLPPDLAMRLARATVSGAGELLHRDPAPAATLRQNVTSPGGTTAAALAILMAEDGMRPLLARAVAAATRRSRELAG
ncbi:MAG TPA: pyrroline-5-carboxylate reductase [Alphaproteobacteria bacterium]|nr:pyrroline-5-carboxylate reductase [Alphaproteobacteria bacterium]